MRLSSTSALFLLLAFLFACNSTSESIEDQKPAPARPSISFTFDDGITNDILDYPFEEWNQMILQALKNHELQAIFFVTGFNKLDEKGQYLLASWDQAQHKIANHTFSHPNYNDPKNTVALFEMELLQTDSIIRSYQNFFPFFRFPYLKEGNSRGKIDSIRTVLQAHNYRNGYVTIDASDWYVNSRLMNQMRSGEPVDTSAFEAFYLDHLIDRAKYYEGLSFELNQRHIKHTILLHHNLTSALFLDSLIERFKSEGWDVIDAEVAYQDSIYQQIPQVVPAGESLIWSLAKESGRYEDQLRYPAEDSRYEKDKMDQLGL